MKMSLVITVNVVILGSDRVLNQFIPSIAYHYPNHHFYREANIPNDIDAVIVLCDPREADPMVQLPNYVGRAKQLHDDPLVVIKSSSSRDVELEQWSDLEKVEHRLIPQWDQCHQDLKVNFMVMTVIKKLRVPLSDVPKGTKEIVDTTPQSSDQHLEPQVPSLPPFILEEQVTKPTGCSCVIM